MYWAASMAARGWRRGRRKREGGYAVGRGQRARLKMPPGRTPYGCLPRMGRETTKKGFRARLSADGRQGATWQGVAPVVSSASKNQHSLWEQYDHVCITHRGKPTTWARIVNRALDAGEGILRLTPNWVPPELFAPRQANQTGRRPIGTPWAPIAAGNR